MYVRAGVGASGPPHVKQRILNVLVLRALKVSFCDDFHHLLGYIRQKKVYIHLQSSKKLRQDSTSVMYM